MKSVAGVLVTRVHPIYSRSQVVQSIPLLLPVRVKTLKEGFQLLCRGGKVLLFLLRHFEF